MKTMYITLILLCLSSFAYAQEVNLKIGRFTDCKGRGTCSISTTQNLKFESSNNAIIMQVGNGDILLRIFREKLTTTDEIQLFGKSITSANRNYLTFVMDEDMPLSSNLKNKTFPALAALGTLKAKGYPTTISEAYIDIKIVSID